MDFNTFENMIHNHNPQEGVIARFYDKAVKTGEISPDGLPIFKNRCFVEIRIKDNNCEIFDQPATAEKIKRFPIEYARYQLAKKQVEEGTPLEQFAFLTAAEIESLKVHGIYTVETLAKMEAEKVAKLGLSQEQNLAKKFILQAKDNKIISDWQKKEDDYLSQIAALKKQIEKLKNISFSKQVRRKS